MAQDDYYYEIQLTNKQLVFYFMAGAAGLVLSFLAGVMVGRGLENGAAAAEPARTVAEEKIVAEQAPTPTPAPTDFSYPQRLESEKPPEGLEKPAVGSPPAAAATPAPATPATRADATTRADARAPTPVPAPAAPVKPRPPAPTPTPAAHAAAGGLPKPIGSSATVKGYAVQVGAFKDKASADSVVKSLKGRSLPAYTICGLRGCSPSAWASTGTSADAEVVADRLRDEKFKPYIMKQ